MPLGTAPDQVHSLAAVFCGESGRGAGLVGPGEVEIGIIGAGGLGLGSPGLGGSLYRCHLIGRNHELRLGGVGDGVVLKAAKEGHQPGIADLGQPLRQQLVGIGKAHVDSGAGVAAAEVLQANRAHRALCLLTGHGGVNVAGGAAGAATVRTFSTSESTFSR